MLVSKEPDSDGMFRVHDGNRRLSVLKIAQDPTLIWDDFKYERDEISKLAEKLQWNTFNCAIYYKRTDAIAESKKIHAKENDGSGTEPWPPIRIARETRNEKSPRYLEALLVIDELRDKEEFNNEQIRFFYTSRFPFTTLDRIVGTKDIPEMIGFKIENRRIEYTSDEPFVLKVLSYIVMEIKDKPSESSWTRLLEKKEDRIDYVNKVLEQLKSPSNNTGGTGTTGGTIGGTGGTTGGGTSGGGPAGKFFETLKWKGKLDQNNKDHAALHCVVEELHKMSVGKKNKRYQQTPVAAGMLVRSAYEQSMKLIMVTQNCWDPIRHKNLENVEKDFGNWIDCKKIKANQKLREGFQNVKDMRTRTFLNNNVHNPDFIRATEGQLEDIAMGGMRAFVQETINSL